MIDQRGHARQPNERVGSMSDEEFDAESVAFPRYSCPSCGQHTVVRELYGMPLGDVIEREARGEVVIAGCEIMPDYTGREVVCTSCGWLGNATRDGRKVRKRPTRRWEE
jgi:predicted RNA-binding Zn-ribbon protein involved in translation (DUF1610 family)